MSRYSTLKLRICREASILFEHLLEKQIYLICPYPGSLEQIDCIFDYLCFTDISYFDISIGTRISPRYLGWKERIPGHPVYGSHGAFAGACTMRPLVIITYAMCTDRLANAGLPL